MGSLVLTGDTSGSVTVAVPAVAGTNTLTLPATTGNVLSSTSQLIGTGTTTNDNASAGQVGQYIEASFTAVTVTTTPANMTSISLTAGDWDVSFRISTGGASATCTSFYPSINTTSGSLGTQGTNFIIFAADAINGGAGGSIPSKRISLSSTTTVYAVCACVAGTIVSTAGLLSARRVR
jgi:hypothetical protein